MGKGLIEENEPQRAGSVRGSSASFCRYVKFQQGVFRLQAWMQKFFSHLLGYLSTLSEPLGLITPNERDPFEGFSRLIEVLKLGI